MDILKGMHKEILSPSQLELLQLVREFRKSFYLVGGTAIALQLGHRRSVDFDLFRMDNLNSKAILDSFYRFKYKPLITRRVSDQINLVVNNVKFTFFQYPYTIDHRLDFEGIVTMPDLIDLAAMKAFALGRRAKWKDYVDLYFIINDHITIDAISKRATEIFGELFSEKQFRAQLYYFDDIDFTEEVEFIGESVPINLIKDKLMEYATDF